MLHHNFSVKVKLKVQTDNKRRRKQRRGQTRQAWSSSLLPSSFVIVLHPKKTFFVESTCVLLFPWVSSHWSQVPGAVSVTPTVVNTIHAKALFYCWCNFLQSLNSPQNRLSQTTWDWDWECRKVTMSGLSYNSKTKITKNTMYSRRLSLVRAAMSINFVAIKVLSRQTRLS